MPKKSTAFMFFTKEWQKENRPNMPLGKAIKETGKIWQKMTPEERRPYNERVGPYAVLRTDGRLALNSYGTPVAHIVAEMKSEEAEIIKMKREIDHKVRKAMNNNAVEVQYFNVMMFNYFNKTEHGDYLPAEISICQFSLEDGIIKFYSTLINPEAVIFGALYDAQKHSQSTHGLPLPPKALGTTDLRQVYLDILKFIYDADSNGILPPVYTFTDQMPLVSSCLRYLNLSAPEEPEIRVYSIHYLFYQMKCVTCELAALAPPKNQFITDAHFERDYFEYHAGLACDFHEEEDRTKYCAQSRVIRWCYMFFDYMCADLAIKLIPAKHFPQKFTPNFTVKEPTETIPSNSKSESTLSSIDVDDSSIDYSILKLESLKINCSSTTTSSCKKNSSQTYYTANNVRSALSLSTVMHDVTEFSSNINDSEDFPDLSSKKNKPKNSNSGTPNATGAIPKTKGFSTKANGKKKLYPELNDTGSDDSILPSSTISFDIQSLASSSISAGAGRGNGKYASTISKLSGKSKNQLGSGRGLFL